MASNFPLWKKTLPPFEEMFRSLQDDRATCSLGENAGDWIVERKYPADHRKADGISNHFTEEVRIDASFSDEDVPRQVFQTLVQRHTAKGTLPTFLRYSPEHQRELVYSGGRECNIFNPAFAKWIYLRLGGRTPRVLDLSAGWGDRAIAAAAAGAEVYHGCDPNPFLGECYRALTAELAKLSPTAVELKIEAGEDYQPPLPEYDVCILSPPFYTLERYVDPDLPESTTQSTERYANYAEWKEGFLRPYYAKAFNHLRDGGWLVVYITDVYAHGQEGDGGAGSKKTKFPLLGDTQGIMKELGAVRVERHGLRVKSTSSFSYSGKSGAPKIRWADVWFRPSTFKVTPMDSKFGSWFTSEDKNHMKPFQIQKGGQPGSFIIREDRLPFSSATRNTTGVPASSIVRQFSINITDCAKGESMSKISATYAWVHEGKVKCQVRTFGAASTSLAVSKARAFGALISTHVDAQACRMQITEKTTLAYNALVVPTSPNAQLVERLKQLVGTSHLPKEKGRVWLFCWTMAAAHAHQLNWGALGYKVLIMPAAGVRGASVPDESWLGEGVPGDLWEMFQLAARPHDILYWEGE